MREFLKYKCVFFQFFLLFLQGEKRKVRKNRFFFFSQPCSIGSAVSSPAGSFSSASLASSSG